MAQDFLTISFRVFSFWAISCGISRRTIRTGISSFSIGWRVCIRCNWHHLLTKSDLPQRLQELWLICAGCEPPRYIGQDFPVWWLQHLKWKTHHQIKSGLISQYQHVRHRWVTCDAQHTHIFKGEQNSCSYSHISQGDALPDQEGSRFQCFIKNLQNTDQRSPGTLLELRTHLSFLNKTLKRQHKSHTWLIKHLNDRITFLSTPVIPIRGNTTAQDTGVSSLSAKLSHCHTWLCCFASTPALFPRSARYQDTALAPLRTASPSPAPSTRVGLERAFRDAGGSSVRVCGRGELNSAATRARRLLKSSGWGDTKRAAISGRDRHEAHWEMVWVSCTFTLSE